LNHRIFKENFEFENYFRILEDKDIYTLCKFRTTNHKLPIETGRWNNIDRVGLSRKFVTMNLFLKFEKCSHSIMQWYSSPIVILSHFVHILLTL
jgi:hypothetical protein